MSNTNKPTPGPGAHKYIKSLAITNGYQLFTIMFFISGFIYTCSTRAKADFF